jgi:nicotinamide-nucleotide amidase
MWQEHAEPLLLEQLSGVSGAAHEVRRLRVFGLGESMLAEGLAHLDWRDPDATIGTRADLDGITLILRGKATEQGRRRLDAVQAEVQSILGDKIYSVTDRGLPAVVGERLREGGLTLSVAESCTGGLLAKRLTDLPGSSDYFLGGVIAYADPVKTRLLDVPEKMLRAHGAVSEQVAAAMAQGVSRATGSDCSLVTTGIAGPDGGTDQKPVGLVYIGSVVRGVTEVERLNLFGRRDHVRERATYSALDLLRRRL